MQFWRLQKKTSTVISLKSATLNGEIVPYTFTSSSKARHVRISIHRGGTLRVTSPRHVSEARVDSFLQEKSTWILSKLAYFNSLPLLPTSTDTKKEYQESREKAYAFVQQRILKLNAFYNFSYNEIHIKNHRTLWGSCSRKKNLNFNYKIAQLKEELADYIIVHELCHLKEFNHGKQFWNLVAQTIPHHKELRKELNNNELKKCA